MRSFGRQLAAAVLVVAAAAALQAQAADPETEYTGVLGREKLLRAELDTVKTSTSAPLMLRRVRSLVSDYEGIARRHPTSGYSDNALWQGALLAGDAFWQFGESRDRQTALRLLDALKARFPTSSLIRRIPEQTARLQKARPTPPDPPARARAEAAESRSTEARSSAKPGSSKPAPAPPANRTAAPATPAPQPAATTTSPATPRSDRQATLTDITREVLPDAVRITLTLDHETPFSSDRLDNPARLFIDLENTRALYDLKDARLAFAGDIVRQIRVGRQQDNRTRVVLDLADHNRFSIYPVYNPYRLVIDFERSDRTNPVLAAAGEKAPPPPPPPTPPSSNGSGGYSIARQLGLGVAKIVIDPGHGGHDPGARVNGLTEAELVLDVAIRLEKLLAAQPGVEVVLTRRTSTFIPLEERTAIANRVDADLFLSIHANASTNTRARGIETYFLNFAQNAEAEAIAARENAGSSRTMRNLPDIVRAIALNNKIDESRDFARLVQRSLYDRLRKVNAQARDLGVKQAPFQVLIGATMPSILAEISFITHKEEGALLKTDDYRQEIAEALLAGVMGYQESLKKVPAVAQQQR